MAMDYKCVPVPETIFTGKTGKDSHSAAVSAYEQLIKNAAQGGWELDQIDSVDSLQSPGYCAALCCKATDIRVSYKLLVFRKAQ